MSTATKAQVLAACKAKSIDLADYSNSEEYIVDLCAPEYHNFGSGIHMSCACNGYKDEHDSKAHFWHDVLLEIESLHPEPCYKECTADGSKCDFWIDEDEDE